MGRQKARSTTNPSPLQRLVARQPWHRWTDEELNLLAYYRIRHWSYARIQRKHFPSFTEKSLLGAFSRLPAKERVYRASIFAGTIKLSRSTPETSHTEPQSEGHDGVYGLLSLRCEDSQLRVPADAAGRYNLRPNRCRNFQQGQSQYPIDYSRFPHFFKSYTNHLKLHGVPDRDYTPPSHSPTPDPSDRSPSIISGPPSTASSLELFGLEARSLSDRDSSVTLGSPREDSLSSEELPRTTWPISRNSSSLG